MKKKFILIFLIVFAVLVVFADSENYHWYRASTGTTANAFPNIENKFTLTLVANPTDGGAVKGGGIYDVGEIVTIEAIPGFQYFFTNWTGDKGVIEKFIYSFEMPAQNLTMTANFGQDDDSKGDWLVNLNMSSTGYKPFFSEPNNEGTEGNEYAFNMTEVKMIFIFDMLDDFTFSLNYKILDADDNEIYSEALGSWTLMEQRGKGNSQPAPQDEYNYLFLGNSHGLRALKIKADAIIPLKSIEVINNCGNKAPFIRAYVQHGNEKNGKNVNFNNPRTFEIE